VAGLDPIDPTQATGKAKALLDAVQAALGLTPNMTRTMAQSSAVLEGYLAMSRALGGGLLSAKLRELIALAVAEANRCQYCLSAHAALGKMVGLGEAEIAASRAHASPDPKTAAALQLASAIVTRRGDVTK
jgi:AhpD family alkylhydroperoxidase